MKEKKSEKIKVIKDETQKGKSHIVVEIIEYEPHKVVSKTILKKTTGSIMALSVAKGEGFNPITSAFDTYIQIIDGEANIVIDSILSLLKTGEGIIIPAHKSCHIKPNGKIKMILTVIKSGYEDYSITI